MAAHDISIQDLLDGDAVITEGEASVEFLDVTEDFALPSALFTWIPMQWISLSDDDKKLLTEKLGIDTKQLDRGVQAAWAKNGEPRRTNMRVCNFRRYGWCESPHASGPHGYCGPIYANRIDGGAPCYTAEQVVRETFVRYLAESRIPQSLKYCHSVRTVWDKLVRDAVNNVNDHANGTVHSTNGDVFCGKLRVNGKLQDRY